VDGGKKGEIGGKEDENGDKKERDKGEHKYKIGGKRKDTFVEKRDEICR